MADPVDGSPRAGKIQGRTAGTSQETPGDPLGFRRVFCGFRRNGPPVGIACRLERQECGAPWKPRLESAGLFRSNLGGLMKRFVTRALIVMVAILGIVLAQVAPASATASKKLPSILGAFWTEVLETPSAQNSFGSGGAAFACWELHPNIVSPGAPAGVESCTVKPGTKIFVSISWECSTVPGDHFDYGTDEADLRQCARDHDLQDPPTFTVDGKSVTVTEVETPEESFFLPVGNIFDLPPTGTTPERFVAHGWVALLNPLTPGTHTIVLSGTATPGGTITTTIVVTPGH
jgi:hypothetical protein